MAAISRRFSRLSLGFPATVIVGDGEPVQIPELTNVAVGGCLIPMDEVVEVGALVHITIHLSENIPLEKIVVEGSVLRCEDGQVAVRFEKIEPGSLHHLQNLILYNSSDPEQVEEEINEHPGLL